MVSSFPKNKNSTMEIIKASEFKKRTTRMYEGSAIVKDANGLLWSIVTMQRHHGSITSLAKKVVSYEDGKVEHDLSSRPKQLITTKKHPVRVNIMEQQQKALELFESKN